MGSQHKRSLRRNTKTGGVWSMWGSECSVRWLKTSQKAKVGIGDARQNWVGQILRSLVCHAGEFIFCSVTIHCLFLSWSVSSGLYLRKSCLNISYFWKSTLIIHVEITKGLWNYLIEEKFYDICREPLSSIALACGEGWCSLDTEAQQRLQEKDSGSREALLRGWRPLGRRAIGLPLKGGRDIWSLLILSCVWVMSSVILLHHWLPLHELSQHWPKQLLQWTGPAT